MEKMDLLLTSAFAGMLALSSINGYAADKGTEKCAGVVKAGKNDCGTSKHSCAGQSKADNDKEEWIAVPKGLCEKLVGGAVKADKK